MGIGELIKMSRNYIRVIKDGKFSGRMRNKRLKEIYRRVRR